MNTALSIARCSRVSARALRGAPPDTMPGTARERGLRTTPAAAAPAPPTERLRKAVSVRVVTGILSEVFRAMWVARCISPDKD